MTELQSGLRYVTLGVSEKMFERLIRKCKRINHEGDAILTPVALKMTAELMDYKSVMPSNLLTQARIWDPRTGYDFLRDGDLLRRLVVLRVEEVLEAEVWNGQKRRHGRS